MTFRTLLRSWLMADAEGHRGVSGGITLGPGESMEVTLAIQVANPTMSSPASNARCLSCGRLSYMEDTSGLEEFDGLYIIVCGRCDKSIARNIERS